MNNVVNAAPANAATKGRTVQAWPQDRAPGSGGVPDGVLAADAARRQAARTKFDGEVAPAAVVERLEEAGRTLLSLPQGGWTTRLRASRLGVVHTAAEAYGWETRRVRPAMPDTAQIDRMDEALGWLGLIPVERHVVRRIVGARALVNPMTERHLFSWRRLGGLIGADHKAVQRWHGEGIGLIVTALSG